MILHDIIKIQFIRSGYLLNYPPHLISDEEMLTAFLKYPTDDSLSDNEKWDLFMSDEIRCMFKDYYPLVPDSNGVISEELKSAYKKLVTNILYHITTYMSDLSNTYVIPNWVYSYMNQATLSVNSSQQDLHDLLVALKVDNPDDIFTSDVQIRCYNISKQWLSKLPPSELLHRSPTMFGAPHVLKFLRLQNV